MNSYLSTRSSEKKSSLVPAAIASLLITVFKCAVLAQGLVGADPGPYYPSSREQSYHCDYDTALDIVHACMCVSGLMTAFVLFERKTNIDGVEESRIPLWVSVLLVIAIPFAVRFCGVLYVEHFIGFTVGGGL